MGKVGYVFGVGGGFWFGVFSIFFFFSPQNERKASFIQSAVFKEWETIQCVIVKV